MSSQCAGLHRTEIGNRRARNLQSTCRCASSLWAGLFIILSIGMPPVLTNRHTRKEARTSNPMLSHAV
jgi:hypothetical protein